MAGMLRHLWILSSDKQSTTCKGEFTSPFGEDYFTAKRVFPLTEEKFLECIEAYNNGLKIQDAFPTLSASEREWFLTGDSVPEEYWTSEEDINTIED